MSDQIKFPAEEGEQIDNLFRKTLGEHTVEPSGNLWKGINRKLLWNEIAHLNFRNVSPKYWITGAGVIAVIIGLFLLVPSRKPATLHENAQVVTPSANVSTGSQPAASLNKPSSVMISKEGKANNTPVPTPVSPAETRKLSAKQKETPVNSSRTAKVNTAVFKPAASNRVEGIASVTKPAPESGNSNGQLNPAETKTTERPVMTTQRSTGTEIHKLHMLSLTDIYPAGLNDTMLTFMTPQGILNVQKEKLAVPQSFSADFGIAPEVINYSTTHNYSELNYWLNAKIGYHFSKFSIQTGVGLGFVYDEGTYNVKYLSKDSIGYFTDIISFYIDPQNQVVFNTKNVAVYDSLQHFADDRTRNRYTYLEIPLMLGYQILETNKLSLDVVCGPSLSFLIGTREAQPSIDYTNARIIRTDDNSPKRVKTNWKIGLGLHLEFRMTKNLGCYIEPSYKYFFNTYTNDTESNARNPYSFGIGLGIQYHFGIINK